MGRRSARAALVLGILVAVVAAGLLARYHFKRELRALRLDVSSYVATQTSPLGSELSSVKAQLAAELAPLKAEIDAVKERASALAAQVNLQTSPVPSSSPPGRPTADSAMVRAGGYLPQPLAGDYRGRSALVFGLFDAVGPYRKNGLFEIYGASLRERRSGPLTVSEAQLEISQDQAWIIWSPDYSPARDATHIEIDFVELPKAGSLTVGFLLGDQTGDSYTFDFGPSTPVPENVLPPLWPEALITSAKSTQSRGKLQLAGTTLRAALSPSAIVQFRSGGQEQIKQLFVHFKGAANTVPRIRQLGLVRPISPPTSSGVAISGLVRGADLPPGTKIELVDEQGRSASQTLALDGGFAFGGLDPRKPVSLRVRHPQLLRYATLGRWFVPAYSRDDLVVEIRPSYVNNDGHAPDPKTAVFHSARTPSNTAALYEPHARQYWPGASKVQEYDSTTFTNNHGYVDRDRFFDNPDGCIRVASTGGSDMVSLQVRVFEKSNIILEEMLGIALGKCVEVISAATDNGDIGTNYPRIRDYTSKFNVDHTLVSVLAGLVFQVNADMLRDGLGMDPENSAFPNFYFDQDGKFTFRPASPVYPAFMTKPSYPAYAKGIPFGSTLAVPFAVMPQQGKEAFRYWSLIVDYIEKHHPGQKFIFHTGIEQAQCRKACKQELPLEGGVTVRAGASGFVENVTEYCRSNGYICINPKFSNAYGDIDTLLTFQYDGHYSPLGQQWLAEELVGPLAKILRGGNK